MRKLLLLLFVCSVSIVAKSQLAVQLEYSIAPADTCINSGKLIAHATGGTPFATGLPYNYIWYEFVENGSGGMDEVLLGFPNDSITPMLADDHYYFVRVKDAAGDSVDMEYFIRKLYTEFHLLDITTSCNFLDDGILGFSIDASALYGPATYLWSTGDTDVYIDSLAPGTYSVILTDTKGCQFKDTAVLSYPPSLTIDYDFTYGCTYNFAGYNERVINIDITTSNGVPDSYLWTSTSGFNSTSQNISNTDNSAAVYKVVVSYNNICKDSVSIPFNAYVPMSVNWNVTDLQCYTGSDGIVQLNVTGGISPYQFNWNGGTLTNLTVSGLGPGTYLLENLSDSIGCLPNLSQSANYFTFTDITVSSPPLLFANAIVTDVACHDSSTGSIDVNVDGGTPFMATGSPVYIFDWNNGQYNTEDLSNVPAGNYHLVITDSLGCTKTLDLTIVNLRPAITTSFTQFNILCNSVREGWAKLTVSGGEPPYQYAWTGPMATIPGDGTDSIYNLQAGRYYVTVTDEFLCQKFDSVLILEPDPIAIVFDTTSVTCYQGTDGSATAIVSGGTAFTTGLPYQYYWTSAGFSATTDAISNIPAANYLLRITDANGCSKDTSIQVQSPAELLIEGNVQEPLCPQSCDGFIQLDYPGGITGGSAPYNFVWSNAGSSLDLTNLCSGDQTITITDAHGCTASKLFELDDPAGEVIHLGPDKIICSNQTYLADATVSQPATYAWTSSNAFTASTPVAAITQSGTYFVQATTLTGGCISKDTITISVSNEQISSEFIVSTQAFRGQTVRVVNVSEPRAASIEWLIPDSPDITVQSSSPAMTELLFGQTGTYTIGMKSFAGSCEDSTKKEVIVVEPEPFNPMGQVDDPLIREFKVWDNPNNGQFNVYIKLKEISRVRLRLINVVTSALVDNRTAQNASEYTLNYNLSLSPGVYALLLETPKSSMVYKILVL